MEVWRKLLQKSLTTAEEVAEIFGLNVGEVRQLAARFRIRINPYYLGLIKAKNDPLYRQVVPDIRELQDTSGIDDPLEEDQDSPVPGIVHRYPDRVLLKAVHVCPVYCRFCFRREVVGPDGGLLTEAELEAALAWFERTPAVREAVLTGGDPFMLSARRLGAILRRLAAVPHIETLRVHTRVPVADPARVDAALVQALRVEKPVYVAVHANHPREFAPEATAALSRLADAGVPLLGQSVLLRGVNDSAEALEALFRAMLRARVKPYYLHALDPAPGVSRFAVPDAEGLRLLEGLRGRVPGHALPVFVRESPAGGGKRPVARASGA